SKHIAAIAGKLAAELFQLKVIAPNIHSEKNNYTRFLVLQREEDVVETDGVNKASINFNTDHTQGSLAKVLTRIAACGINLSKLQSFPIPGSNWQYSFHADLEFDKREQLDTALKEMEPVTQHLRVYGIYKKGDIIR
ncbi:MAG: chorismate mutase, partial [Flavisolibacter sp.]|nr:chorismate mutase [Flavisolibacter sp.]